MIQKTCINQCGRTTEIELNEGEVFWDASWMCDHCIQDKEREALAAQGKRNLQRRFNESVALGFLPRNFQRYAFRNSDFVFENHNHEAWQECRQWDRQKNLFLYGDVGTGKSHAAMGCLLEAFAAGQHCMHTTARRILKDSDRFDEGGGSFRHALEVGVLLLDDIDKADPSPARLAALWELFDERSQVGQRTIMTSNIMPSELVNLFQGGKRTNNTSMAVSIVDRMNPIQCVRFTGTSLRGVGFER